MRTRDMASTSVRRVLPVLAAGMLLLAGCGSDSTDSTSPQAATSSSSTPSAGTGSSTPSVPETPAAPPLPTFVITGKNVEGPDRIEAKVGDTVEFMVTADKTDEVHIHGYDETTDVQAGKAQKVTLTANIPGTFEIELEEAGLELTSLRVTP